MKVKELIEKLQKCNPEAEVVKSDSFEYWGVHSVTEIFLTEMECQEGYGVETVWIDCQPDYKEAFHAVLLGL